MVDVVPLMRTLNLRPTLVAALCGAGEALRPQPKDRLDSAQHAVAGMLFGSVENRLKASNVPMAYRAQHEDEGALAALGAALGTGLSRVMAAGALWTEDEALEQARALPWPFAGPPPEAALCGFLYGLSVQRQARSGYRFVIVALATSAFEMRIRCPLTSVTRIALGSAP
jgi:hypothetical protein